MDRIKEIRNSQKAENKIKNPDDPSLVAMMLLFYHVNYAEEQLMRWIITRLQAQGLKPGFYHETKQRHTELMRISRRALQLVGTLTDGMVENHEAFAAGLTEHLGTANNLLKFGLLMAETFGNDYNRVDEFLEEVVKQTGGREGFQLIKEKDFDHFKLK